jgi:hypothetical protein
MLPRLLGNFIQMRGQLAEFSSLLRYRLCHLAHGGGVFLELLENCLGPLPDRRRQRPGWPARRKG